MSCLVKDPVYLNEHSILNQEHVGRISKYSVLQVNWSIHVLGLYQCLLGDLDPVKEKYVTIAVELEVDMSEISMLEAKYSDNQSTIFASMLLVWMDSCSSKNYIKEICNALAAVNELSLAEMIMDKYQAWRGKRLCKLCLTWSSYCFRQYYCLFFLSILFSYVQATSLWIKKIQNYLWNKNTCCFSLN